MSIADSICGGCWLRWSGKNTWTISEFTGERRPSVVQRFVSLTPWDADGLRDEVRAYALEQFADDRGVLIADPTGFAKKGRKSAGVQRQYSGTLGRIDNCQIGAFLAYANTAGNRVLIDRELYIPKDSWCADLDRRREAGVPDELTFQTRPQQVQTMIDRTVAGGVPFAWFAADEEFGQNPGLRAFLEEAPDRLLYCGSQEHRRDHRQRLHRGRLPDLGKGPRRGAETARLVASFLRDRHKGFPGLRLGGHRPPNDNQYVFRRNITDGEIAYFHCYNPRKEGLSELVRVIGSRWPMECFEAAEHGSRTRPIPGLRI